MIELALCGGPVVDLCSFFLLTHTWQDTEYMKEKDIFNIESCNQSPLVLQTSHSVMKAVCSR